MQRKRMSFAILMTLAIIMISMSVLTIRMYMKEDISDKYSSIQVAAIETERLYINSNEALDTYCSGKGTDGLSWDTAHVIENLEFDTGGHGDGLYIRDTNKLLILRNITVRNTGKEPQGESAGIKIDNCKNIKITKCDVNDNQNGIILWRSGGITVSDNTAVYNELRGIWLRDDPLLNIVSGNNVSYNGGHGIMLKASDNNIISGNNISCNGGYGVSVNFMSDNNEIYDNSFCDNTKGDYEDDGDNNDIHDNFFPGNPDGPTIPGYPLVWILGFVVCGFTVLFTILLRKTLKKRKRNQ